MNTGPQLQDVATSTQAEVETLRRQARTLRKLLALTLGLFMSALILLGALVLVGGLVLDWRAEPRSLLEQSSAARAERSGLPDHELYTPTPDPGIDMIYIPGLRNESSWATDVPLRTNWAGMRDPREFGPKAPGTFRVLICGDSMVAAHASPYEDGVAPQLEALLNEHALRGAGVERYEVYPVAVSGWNIFSSVRFVLHNLHALQPDVVVLALNKNDMDSGSGFVLGNTRVSLYDAQRLRGASHASIMSPSYFLRASAGVMSLIGTDLIPESRVRFDLAAAELERLKLRVEQDSGGALAVYLYDPLLLPGLLRTCSGFLGAEDVIVGSESVTSNNLLPLDGHPNRAGHAIHAATLLDYLSKRGWISLDARAEPLETPEYVHWRDYPPREDLLYEYFQIDAMPAAFEVVDGELQPESALRCVVGGVYPQAWLSPRAIFVLRNPRHAGRVALRIEFPGVPALVDRKLSVYIDGELVESIDARGSELHEFVLPPASVERELVEVVLESDGYFTDLSQGLVDGVWGATPKVGRLLGLGLVEE